MAGEGRALVRSIPARCGTGASIPRQCAGTKSRGFSLSRLLLAVLSGPQSARQSPPHPLPIPAPQALQSEAVYAALQTALPEHLALAASPQLAENSRLGFAPVASTSRWGSGFSISSNTLGLSASLYDGRVRSRSTGKERDAESGNDYFQARYYSSAMGRFMSPDWSAKEEPVPYAKLDDPQTLNLYAYVGNNPLVRMDPTGHATCANPPSCTMSTIDAHPAGEKGPTITFKNDDPKGKDPNQPVTTKTAVMVEKAVVKSGVDSVNINSTTGGKHAETSNHAKGRAVDIDTVNGTSVRSQGASPAVKSLQSAFAASPDVRENFGPSRMEKTSTPGGTAQPFGNSQLTEDHEGHIHESSQP